MTPVAEKLKSDLRDVAKDAGSLMNDAAKSTMDATKDSLVRTRDTLREQRDATASYVSGHPGRTMALGALAGVAVGYLLASRQGK